MVITIDGPAGSGKSTAARELAKALGIAYLDTGATYRAVTLKALRNGADLRDESALAEIARTMDIRMVPTDRQVGVWLDGRDVSREIRTEEVSANSHYAARAAAVRAVLVELQRRIGRDLGSFVTEGRDQGTVVFPDADVKFYLDARPETRAARRCEERRAAGENADYQRVLQAIVQRDQRDSTRQAAPLTRPADAIVVDTSDHTIEQMAAELLQHVQGTHVKAPTSYPNPRLSGVCLPAGVPSPNPFYRLMRLLFRVTVTAWMKVRVFDRRYEPASGSAVYICNHQSFMDPILMSYALRRGMNYMARDTLFHTPGFNHVIHRLSAFPVRRGTADLAAMKEAMRRLKAGQQLVLFAEGTRTTDGRIGPFLPGVALLAQRVADWTVPVMIDGAFEAWPRTQLFPSPGSVVVRYAPPIPQSETRKMSAEELVNHVRRIIIDMQTESRRRLGKPELRYE